MKTAFLLFFTSSALFAQSGQFKSVKIGNQVWMVENLNVDKFRNGDPIPQAKTNTEWKAAGNNKQPAWCYYDNDPKNGTKYGKLYNWYAVNDSRGLAPISWHIPSDAEWTQLTNFLGGIEVAGQKIKSTNGWMENGNGTNSSGFSGLPGGNNEFGVYDFIGLYGSWWSSTEINTRSAQDIGLSYMNGNIYGVGSPKEVGLSVRCLKD